MLYAKAPELAGISGYLNTDSITIAEELAKGHIVLIDFWTYTCINCIRTLPYLTEWDRKYRDAGLTIIGVHTPEFDFEKQKDNVQMALDKYGIKYPVVQDNDYGTWNAFRNRYWPRKYLIDTDGFIRYDHAGEGGYEETEKVIQELLAEKGAKVEMDLTKEVEKAFVGPITPELYAGFMEAVPRGQNLGNEGGFRSIVFDYKLPLTIPADQITLQGKWEAQPEVLVAEQDGALLYLNYTASEVNIVLEIEGEESAMSVLEDGIPLASSRSGSDVIDGEVSVKESRLYNLINGEYGNHLLALNMSKGVNVAAFTFG